MLRSTRSLQAELDTLAGCQVSWPTLLGRTASQRTNISGRGWNHQLAGFAGVFLFWTLLRYLFGFFLGFLSKSKTGLEEISIYLVIQPEC